MSLQATSMQCFIATYSLLIDCFISAALVSSNALLLCDIDAPKRLAWLTTVPSCVIVARLMLSTYSCRVMLLRDVASRCCFLKSWREATWKFPGACMRVCVCGIGSISLRRSPRWSTQAKPLTAPSGRALQRRLLISSHTVGHQIRPALAAQTIRLRVPFSCRKCSIRRHERKGKRHKILGAFANFQLPIVQMTGLRKTSFLPATNHCEPSDDLHRVLDTPAFSRACHVAARAIRASCCDRFHA
jgi:hypothetical protein